MRGDPTPLKKEVKEKGQNNRAEASDTEDIK